MKKWTLKIRVQGTKSNELLRSEKNKLFLFYFREKFILRPFRIRNFFLIKKKKKMKILAEINIKHLPPLSEIEKNTSIFIICYFFGFVKKKIVLIPFRFRLRKFKFKLIFKVFRKFWRKFQVIQFFVLPNKLLRVVAKIFYFGYIFYLKLGQIRKKKNLNVEFWNFSQIF